MRGRPLNPLALASSRFPGFARAARLATGAISLLLGAWLLYQIGWKDGLFFGSAHWTPD